MDENEKWNAKKKADDENAIKQDSLRKEIKSKQNKMNKIRDDYQKHFQELTKKRDTKMAKVMSVVLNLTRLSNIYYPLCRRRRP